ARYEEGKFGDQKYLDCWPELFSDDVHVLANKELILAPWNATRFPYGNGILWHFHSLRITSANDAALKANLGNYSLPSAARRFVYNPYLNDLRSAILLMKRHGIAARPQQKSPTIFEKTAVMIVDILRHVTPLRRRRIVEF